MRLETPGHVYILKNKSMPGLLKVGMTTKGVSRRICQLSSSTGVPTPFELVAEFETPTPRLHESVAHEIMTPTRVSCKEFFSVDEDTAILCCKTAITFFGGGK